MLLVRTKVFFFFNKKELQWVAVGKLRVSACLYFFFQMGGTLSSQLIWAHGKILLEIDNVVLQEE